MLEVSLAGASSSPCSSVSWGTPSRCAKSVGDWLPAKGNFVIWGCPRLLLAPPWPTPMSIGLGGCSARCLSNCWRSARRGESHYCASRPLRANRTDDWSLRGHTLHRSQFKWTICAFGVERLKLHRWRKMTCLASESRLRELLELLFSGSSQKYLLAIKLANFLTWSWRIFSVQVGRSVVDHRSSGYFCKISEPSPRTNNPAAMASRT